MKTGARPDRFHPQLPGGPVLAPPATRANARDDLTPKPCRLALARAAHERQRRLVVLSLLLDGRSDPR